MKIVSDKNAGTALVQHICTIVCFFSFFVCGWLMLTVLVLFDIFASAHSAH